MIINPTEDNGGGMIVYVVEEGFYEPSLCGVYTTEEAARIAIAKKVKEINKDEFTIYPYHTDGEIENSAALWFVHKTIDGNVFANSTSLDYGSYPIGEVWVEEVSRGKYTYNRIIWARDESEAKLLAGSEFDIKKKELGI